MAFFDSLLDSLSKSLSPVTLHLKSGKEFTGNILRHEITNAIVIMGCLNGIVHIKTSEIAAINTMETVNIDE